MILMDVNLTRSVQSHNRFLTMKPFSGHKVERTSKAFEKARVV